MTSATDMNRSYSWCGPLTWLVYIGVIAGHLIDDHNEVSHTACYRISIFYVSCSEFVHKFVDPNAEGYTLRTGRAGLRN